MFAWMEIRKHISVGVALVRRCKPEARWLGYNEKRQRSWVIVTRNQMKKGQVKKDGEALIGQYRKE